MMDGEYVWFAKIQGLKTTTTKDTIENYFNNKRRSGVEGVCNVKFQSKEGSCIVYFNKDITKTIQKQYHELDDHLLKITDKGRDFAFFKDRVLISGISEITTRDCLASFVEARSKATPVTILFAQNGTQAVIDFEKDIDLTLLQQELEVYTLDGSKIEMTQIQFSSSVVVTGCHANESKDSLLFYFDNKKQSGGGDVKYVKGESNNEENIVSFKSPKSASGVINRLHKLHGRHLNVQLYYDCIGIPDRSMEWKNPTLFFIFQTDNRKLKFLLSPKGEHLRQMMDARVKEKSALLEWPSYDETFSCLRVKCTRIPNSNEDSGLRLRTWKSEALYMIEDEFSKILVKTSRLGIKEQMLLMRLKPSKFFTYSISEFGEITLIGHENEIVELEKEILELIQLSRADNFEGNKRLSEVLNSLTNKQISFKKENETFENTISLNGYFAKGLKTISCIEGQRATFRCYILVDKISPRWFKDDEEIFYSEKFHILVEGRECRLEIHNVCISDRGNYSIEVLRQRSIALLNIEEYFINHEEMKQVLEGQDTNFYCEVIEAINECRWYKDSAEIKKSNSYEIITLGGQSTLCIRNSVLSHEGMYTVLINGRKRNFFLTVKGYFSEDLENVSCIEGSGSVDFECIAINENMSAKWFKDNAELKSSDKYRISVAGACYKLTINWVDLNDAGVYIIDINGRRRKAVLEVTEFFSDNIESRYCVEGEDVCLVCEVIGDNLQSKWSHDEEELCIDDKHSIIKNGKMHKLLIQNVNLKDAGEYTVEIDNRKRSTVLGVEEFFARNLESKRCFEEDDVSFICEVMLHNVAASWFKDGESIQLSEKYSITENQTLHKLEILNVDMSDSGEYSVEIDGRKRSAVLEVEEFFLQNLVSKSCFEEDNISFDCSVAVDNLQCIWFYGEDELLTHGKYITRSEGKQHELTINNVDMNDAGEYSIYINNKRRTALLKVEEFFLKSPESTTSYEGDDIYFLCEVVTENLSATWFHDGTEVHCDEKFHILSDGIQHKLIISNLNLKDVGEYVVEIESRRRKAYLNVKEFFLKDLENKHCLEGKDICFACEVVDDHLSPTWFFNMKELLTSEKFVVSTKENRHILEISNVDIDDAGEYCVEVKARRKKAFLSVEAFYTERICDRTCLEGDELELTCEVVKEDLTARWFKNERQITNCDRYTLFTNGKMHKLVIKCVELNDAGDYMVEIEGRTRTGKLNVNGFFTKDIEVRNCSEGDTAEMVCEVVEDNANAKWLKDGKEIQNGDRYLSSTVGKIHKLTIKHVEVNDAGDYTINIKDRTRKAKLDVKGFFTKDIEVRNCSEGDTVEMVCEVVEDNANAKWLKDGKEIQNGDRYLSSTVGKIHKLTIKHVEVNDAGDYTINIKDRTRKAKLDVKGQACNQSALLEYMSKLSSYQKADEFTIESGKKPREIRDCTSLSNGDWAFVDAANSCVLLRYNDGKKKKNSRRIDGNPMFLTSIKDEWFAIALVEKKRILIVDSKELEAKRYIPFEKTIFGLQQSDGRLFVREDGVGCQAFANLTSQSKPISTIQFCDKSSPYFTVWNNRVTTTNWQKNKICSYDEDGQLIWESEDNKDLVKPNGITTDSFGNIIVTATQSHKVWMFPNDKNNGKPHFINIEAKYPIAVDYNKSRKEFLCCGMRGLAYVFRLK